MYKPLQMVPSQMAVTKSESAVGGSSRCTVMVTMMSSVGSSPLWNSGTLIMRACVCFILKCSEVGEAAMSWLRVAWSCSH